MLATTMLMTPIAVTSPGRRLTGIEYSRGWTGSGIGYRNGVAPIA